jgi:Holliday junction resolvase-like predicted endonuclease
VVASNVSVGRGELDLVGIDNGERTVFEVRSVRGMSADSLDAFDEEKRQQVRRLASKLDLRRIDFVGVAFRDDGLELHWVPRC